VVSAIAKSQKKVGDDHQENPCAGSCPQNQRGLSYYSYERICSLLDLRLEQYIAARDGLINKELIAFDGTLFQVLELPAAPISCERA
jgi:hypothetical protein